MQTRAAFWAAFAWQAYASLHCAGRRQTWSSHAQGDKQANSMLLLNSTPKQQAEAMHNVSPIHPVRFLELSF